MTNRPSSIRTIQLLFLSLAFILLPAIRARAGGPVVWETDSRSELLGGESHGVSVTDTGTLMLAPRFTQLFNTEQAYVWSSAADEAGNVYLGTGHDGKIFRVSADGKGSLLYDAQELDVTALVVGRDGALYAGTSPDGKVYRITPDGKADVYFDPPDKYIWSLAFLGDGSLAVGTGDTGKLYRVSSAGAKPEASLLIDTNETHIISLAVDRQGNLIAGTDPGGLVLRVSTDGKAFALYDSPLREIHSLSVAPDGSIYALALSDAATGPRASSSTAQSSQSVSASSAGGTVTGTVTVTDESGAQVATAGVQPQTRSRNELQNARSAVFRISPDGGADVLWSSTTVTAFSVAASPRGSGVLVGTSDKGRIYSVTDDGRDTLLIQSSEDQISTLVVRGRDVFAASSNQGKLFRFGADALAEGTYESPVRDAKFVATWGRIWWRGRGQVELQTRSGNTEKPDKTWSDWSTPYRDPSGVAVASPHARFVQWRAVLRTGAQGGDASVEDVSLAYLPRNVAPEVTQIQVLPIGIALLPAVQIPVDPNVEASGLDPSLLGPQVQIPPRRMFQRGAVSLQWQAEDRNGDQLEYSVYYRPVGDNTFHLLKEHLRDNFYSTDGATLGDGRYVFKVVASDAPENSLGQALTGERVSEPVDVDSTPPVVKPVGEPQVTADGHARVRFTVDDASGMIRRADVSLDSGEWHAIFPEDGIADSPHETYSVELPLTSAGEHTISLRAIDGSGNVGSARVVVRR